MQHVMCALKGDHCLCYNNYTDKCDAAALYRIPLKYIYEQHLCACRDTLLLLVNHCYTGTFARHDYAVTE
jgi:hypothetical protein